MFFFSPGSTKLIHYARALKVHVFDGGAPSSAKTIQVTDADLLQAALDQSLLGIFRAFSPAGDAHSKLRDLQQKNGDVWVCIPHSRDFMYTMEVLEAADAGLGPSLHTAVKEGSLERVQLYLDCPHAVKMSILKGDTPLMLAVRGEHMAIAEALLWAGADSNARNSDFRGLTPLMQAAEMGNVELIRMLLAHGADVNAVDNTFTTALISAARQGHLDAVQVLLHAGANVNATLRPVAVEGCRGYSALLAAAKNGHADTVKALQEANADKYAVDTQGNTALMLGVQSKNVHVVTALLPSKENVDATNANHQTALMMASAGGKVEIVQALLHAGAQVDRVGNNAQPALTYAKNAQVIALLKEAQAHLEQRFGKGSLAEMASKYATNAQDVDVSSAQSGDMAAVGKLLTFMQPLPGTKAALYNPGVKNAIKNGDVGYLEIMHRFGSLFINDYLLTAIRDGDAAGVDTLLRAGANANFKFVGQTTPMMIATYLKHGDIVNKLVAAGADIDAVSAGGHTALQLAIDHGDIRIVEILINAQVGIDIERGNKTGVLVSTPGGQEAMEKKLLQAKVDTASVNELWKAAQAYAHRLGQKEIVEMLAVAREKIGFPVEEEVSLQVLAQESERALAAHAQSQPASAGQISDADTPAGAMEGVEFYSMYGSVGGLAVGNAPGAGARSMMASEEARILDAAAASGHAYAPASAHAAAAASGHAYAPASAHAAAAASGHAYAPASAHAAAAASGYAYAPASAHAAAAASGYAFAPASAHAAEVTSRFAAAAASTFAAATASDLSATSASASNWNNSTLCSNLLSYPPAPMPGNADGTGVDHEVGDTYDAREPEPCNAAHDGGPIQQDLQCYLLLPPSDHGAYA